MMVALMRLWRPAMTLAPDEQHARLRIERSLRRDPAPRAAADAFSRGCPYGRNPAHECVSPWHPCCGVRYSSCCSH